MSADAEAATSGPGGAGTCYRHPGRETYISCTRCGRPICPDCMVPASVGFQCPECVRQGNAGQRHARTVFGGKLSARHNTATLTLIGINVLVFLVQQASNTFTYKYALLPTAAAVRTSTGVTLYQGVAQGQYDRLLTSMFMHENVLHILFNMWALYVVGPPLEALFGRLRYVVMYLLAGLAGAATAYWLAAPNSLTLGASGAIFGLFGALFVVSRRLRLNIGPIAATIGLNLVLTFSISGISWQGHVGGLLAGAALAAAWAYPPRHRRTAAQLASSALLALVIVVVVVARTHALTS